MTKPNRWKKRLMFLSAAALVAFTSLPMPSRAQDPAAPAAAAPAATLEQRVGGLEAYFGNGDPSAALKGADGVIPEGLTMASVGVAGPGHNGFMMICAALVLFMTLPGLALFYGGLVRRKNVLSVLAQCLGITGLVAILWWAVGYSMVFADGEDIIKGFVGNLKFKFLDGVDSVPNTNYAYWVSHNVWSMYQLMFAIITPALIVGAVAERMKFSAILLFVTLWMLVVYFPLAHMVWGINGFMNGVWNAGATVKAIDFAGGTVVHMSSGWSALLLCMLLGKREGYGKVPMPPHSMVLCMVGTGMLWVGWYGFNAGSAAASDAIAANAFMTTTMATAVASFVWGMAEWLIKGKPSVLGFCSGVVAGLVVITPATGFVTVSGAVIIGILAGIIPFLAVTYLKKMIGCDDALDTFGVHGVGGTLGAIMTGILATDKVNGNLKTNLTDYVGSSLWVQQLIAIVITIALALIGTLVITFVVKAVVGLRPSPEEEETGLDMTDHGEQGYYEH